MTEILLHIPGPPVSQGSKNAYRRGNKVVLVETRHRELQDYRTRIMLATTPAQRILLLDSPLHVEATFILARPKRPKFDAPAVPPDLDKYVRALFDGITQAGVWKDDARAVSIHATKRYVVGLEEPHTNVLIRPWKETT